MGRPREAPYLLQSVSRALEILGAFREGPAVMGPSELGRRLTLPRGLVHRTLQTLERHGFLDRDPGTRGYRLGFACVALGEAAQRNLEPAARVRPALAALCRDLGETVHLAGLEPGAAVSWDSVVPPDRSLRPEARVGQRFPLHASAVGKVLLAWLPAEGARARLGRDPLPRYTPRTITDVGTFAGVLAEVRERGYALDEEEFEQGLCCIGAPVRDHAGRVVAAVAVQAPTGRLMGAAMPRAIERVVAAGADASRRLGWGG